MVIDTNKIPMTLDEIHSTQVKIVKHIDEICSNNGIRYSMAYGSLLGAIRHKGFIPWDDDMDIMLLRPDYERLVKLLTEEHNPEFCVINYNNAYFPWTKLIDAGTYIIESRNFNIKNYGLWVDIFPIDEMPLPNTSECKKYLSRLKILKELAKIRAESYSHVKDLKGAKAIKFALVKTPLMLFPITFFGKRWNKTAQKYNGKNTGYKGYPFFDPPIKASYFDNYELTEFEGEQLQRITEYDAYLTEVYGDYMQLPPVEERNSGHTFDAYRK